MILNNSTVKSHFNQRKTSSHFHSLEKPFFRRNTRFVSSLTAFHPKLGGAIQRRKHRSSLMAHWAVNQNLKIPAAIWKMKKGFPWKPDSREQGRRSCWINGKRRDNNRWTKLRKVLQNQTLWTFFFFKDRRYFQLLGVCIMTQIRMTFSQRPVWADQGTVLWSYWGPGHPGSWIIKNKIK